MIGLPQLRYHARQISPNINRRLGSPPQDCSQLFQLRSTWTDLCTVTRPSGIGDSTSEDLFLRNLGRDNFGIFGGCVQLIPGLKTPTLYCSGIYAAEGDVIGALLPAVDGSLGLGSSRGHSSDRTCSTECSPASVVPVRCDMCLVVGTNEDLPLWLLNLTD